MAASHRNILISGAGIAGPALAYWLKRYGFSPTVVEQAPKPRTGGYVFHLHGLSGIEVLKRTGVWDKILEHRRIDREFMFVDRSDRALARLQTPAAVADVEASGEQITIRRSDVARVLYDHTRNDVEYIFGNSVRRLDDSRDGVKVSFEHGGDAAYDLVIGADGLHSAVRKIAFGEEVLFKRFLGYYVAAFTAKDYPIGYGTDITYFAPGLLVSIFGMKAREGIAVFVFRREKEFDSGADDIESQKQALKDAIAQRDWKIPELFEQMDAAPDFWLDSVSQIRMERWSKGRIALVGDAGYCPTLLSGFGAQLALAGAYTLAGELMRADGDFARAFAAYEEKLRPFVAEKQKNPERSTRYIPGSPSGLWVLQQVIRLLSLPGVSKLLFRATYGHLIQDSFKLTDYEGGGEQPPVSEVRRSSVAGRRN